MVGVTGPPGVGKSTLLSALLREWRSRGAAVAVLAVDPSSKRSGGALLGDRARIEHDPADRDVFIRSMAAGERLGGLAPATRAAAQALAAAFDVVVIETVGVGQSETDVAEAADTVAVVVQPGSGDALQFLKAGIMEVPDVLVVTKADLGAVAARAPSTTCAPRSARSAPRDARSLAVSSIAPGDGHRRARRRARRPPRGARPRRRAARAPAGSARSPTSCRARRARPARALGGRRAATRWLEQPDPGARRARAPAPPRGPPMRGRSRLPGVRRDDPGPGYTDWSGLRLEPSTTARAMGRERAVRAARRTPWTALGERLARELLATDELRPRLTAAKALAYALAAGVHVFTLALAGLGLAAIVVEFPACPTVITPSRTSCSIFAQNTGLRNRNGLSIGSLYQYSGRSDRRRRAHPCRCGLACRCRTGVRVIFGARAMKVPNTTIATPIQIQAISGLTKALMIGCPVSGSFPSNTV